MNKQPLIHHGYAGSPLVYGCMGLGGGWNGEPVSEADYSHALLAVEKALDEGITLFDHADIYTLGKAETVFGRILKERPALRDQIRLQSKCGIRFESGQLEPKRYDFSAGWIVQSVEGILRRLNTDHLDYLLLHRPDPLMEPEETAIALSKLVTQGKVKHIGVSNFSFHQIELLQNYLDQPICINQLEFSLTHLQLIESGVMVNNQTEGMGSSLHGTLEYCMKNKIQIQAWSSLSKGVLSQKPGEGASPGHQQVYRVLEQLTQKYQVSSEAIQLAWIIRHPAGIQPVLGTTNPERIRQCADALKIQLTREEWYALYVAARGGKLP